MEFTKNAWKRMTSGLAAVLMLGSAVAASGAPAKKAAPAAAKEEPVVASAEVMSRGPIKIGYIVPLSGAAQAAGKTMENGFNLYLDQIGHKMAGRSVDFIVESDESNPATGVAKVHKLVKDDKVHMLAGQYLANVLYKVAPVANEYGIPFIDTVSGADDITQRKRMKWVVRTSWTSSGPTHPFGEYVAKKLGYKKIVTIASDYAYGYEVVGGFQKSFEANGGQVVQKLWAPLGFTDFKDMITQIRPDADAVFMCIVGQSAEVIPKQFKEFGPKLPIIGATTSFDESILPKVGEQLLGGVSCNPYSLALDRPENKKFVAAYTAKFGKDPGWAAECGYVSAMWINKAVDAVKGDVEDREKLMGALRKVELANAPRGPLKMDPYGMVTENIYIRKVEKVNGKIQNTVVFTYPGVSQFWKWHPDEYMKAEVYGKDNPACTHCALTK
jgi:branched-chain amino acid transport system substrate-binding protein